MAFEDTVLGVYSQPPGGRGVFVEVGSGARTHSSESVGSTGAAGFGVASQAPGGLGVCISFAFEETLVNGVSNGPSPSLVEGVGRSGSAGGEGVRYWKRGVRARFGGLLGLRAGT